jgi:hypothetical protein
MDCYEGTLMPATAELLEEGHILKYVVSDPWTMDDIYHITREGKQVYDNSPHRVHLIVDVTQTHRVPPSFLSVRNVPDLNHPNSGHIAVIGAAGMVKIMVDLVARFFPGDKVTYFSGEAEALDYLQGVIAEEHSTKSDQ